MCGRAQEIGFLVTLALLLPVALRLGGFASDGLGAASALRGVSSKVLADCADGVL